ncbi:MAG: DUF4956 domain-containing protein [Planctomycetes bacterium]|nr:DUF4956 domain-containing protein [Planctomycetota bacterium]
MDELWRIFRTQGGQGEALTRWETLLALTLCGVLMLVVSGVYRFTHKSSSYSQSYVHSLVLMGLITTVIMIVIGSNIARAFSLVGALSIIRFRNAVKETRDVAYIFFAMAIAMACGTRFYVLACMATGILGSMMILLHVLDFAAPVRRAERLLKIQMPSDQDAEAALEPTLLQLFQSYSVISLETARQGLYTQVVYSVLAKPGITGAQVLDAITKVNGNLKVTYNYSAHTDDL